MQPKHTIMSVLHFAGTFVGLVMWRESSKGRSPAVPSNAFRCQPVSEFIDCSELPAVDLSLSGGTVRVYTHTHCLWLDDEC